MENKICNTAETQWMESVTKRLHKMKVTIDIIGWSVLALTAIIGCYLHICVGESLEHTLGQLACWAAFLFVIGVLCLLPWIGDTLESCYCSYRCKTCGHIHRPKAEELNKTTDVLYCPECNQDTKHTMVRSKKV